MPAENEKHKQNLNGLRIKSSKTNNFSDKTDYTQSMLPRVAFGKNQNFGFNNKLY